MKKGITTTEGNQDELRKHQIKCMEALKILDGICKREGIQFYLIGGTALGGVRHKGFIPWDDDIDIAIINSDRNVLEKALQEGIVGDFEYISERNCENFPRLHGKILYKKRCCIDVFTLSRIHDNKLIAHVQWIIHKILLKVFYKKINYKIVDRNIFFGMIAHLLANVTSKETILKLIESNYNACKKSKRWINFNGIYPLKKEMLKPEYIIDKDYVMFENSEFRVYGHVKDYLKDQYGDFMKLPPEEKRRCTHLELFEDCHSFKKTDKEYRIRSQNRGIEKEDHIR